MKVKSLIKGSLLALALATAGFASSAQAVTVGWNLTSSPTWVYVWAQNVGSNSGTITGTGYYSWYKSVPSGTFVQLMCDGAQTSTRVYSNYYLRCY